MGLCWCFISKCYLYLDMYQSSNKFNSKKDTKVQDELTRIAIVSNDRCKPKKCRQECKKSCPVVRMGRMCIEAAPDSKLAYISEELCIGCGICVKVSLLQRPWLYLCATGPSFTWYQWRSSGTDMGVSLRPLYLQLLLFKDNYRYLYRQNPFIDNKR